MYLLNCRNAPEEGEKISPAELMTNINRRSKLPGNGINLKPALVNNTIYNEMIGNHNKQKFYYNCQAKATSEDYNTGDDIFNQNNNNHNIGKKV